MNKFLLASRLFQRGTAAMETVKRDYQIRELLAEKTLLFEQTQEAISEKLGRTKSMKFATDIDELVASNQRETYDRRRNGIKVLINLAKDDFFTAILNLDLSDEANSDMERSLLDCAIHMSFMILELTLYERIIEGHDSLATVEEADAVYKHNNWSGVI